MAHRVRERFRELPDDIHQTLYLAGKNGWGDDRLLTEHRKRGDKPLIKQEDFSKELKKASKANKVPIIQASKGTIRKISGLKDADGLAVEHSKSRHSVYIHPAVKYRGKKYLKDLIKHETDHINVMRKNKRKDKPISNKSMKFF